MTVKEFNTALKHISQIQAHLVGYEKIMKPLEAELADLKVQVIDHMQKTSNKRTEAVNGYYVVRAERKNINVVDELAITDWLQANNFDINSYYSIDKPMIRTTAEQALKVNGEVIPGIEYTSTEYLTIKEVK